jgi:hypothetical protein
MSEYKQIQYPLSVKWDATVKTGNFNAETTYGYFVDTTSAQVTATLPANPAVGDQVAFKDYAGTFGTNKLLIARNGSNIQGNASDSQLTTNRGAGVLVYVDSTQGWVYQQQSNASDNANLDFVSATGGTITTDGDFKIHTFNSSGTFTVTNAGTACGSNTVDYLVIAGGGGGGNFIAGGGGAGGYRESFPNPATGGFPISVQGYPITVGGGGATGAPCAFNKGVSGSPSVFSTITSAGGGGGGAFESTPGFGATGGSGGGGGGKTIDSGVGAGGAAGNTPPVSPPQGNPGGNGQFDTGGGDNDNGGGGGGASVAGSNASPTAAGDGGDGSSSSITGSSVARGGGGGGAARASSAPGSGGTGGGGNGGSDVPGNTVTAGTANTGGGGGGGGFPANIGQSGGSGVVIIRYKFQ